jgi:hypothetical protein
MTECGVSVGGACARTCDCLGACATIQYPQARDFESSLYPPTESIYLPHKMSADTISNPQPAGESKSARKKREKAEAAAAAEAAGQNQQDSDGQKTPEATDTNGDAFESSYVKELQKYVA